MTNLEPFGDTPDEPVLNSMIDGVHWGEHLTGAQRALYLHRRDL